MGSDNMKKTIYLDNAATTFPKPEIVYEKMDYINRNLCVNAGRGSYGLAREATKLIDSTRNKIKNLVNAKSDENIIFTSSITMSLNQILNGLIWNSNYNVYVSPFEHNAVARTINLIRQKYGINVIVMPLVDGKIEIDVDKLRYMFTQKHPTHICMTHISNVTGYILPINEILDSAKKYEAITIIDSAQSLGLIPIDLQLQKIDFLAFAGHKTLYGPFGIGGFVNNSKIKLENYIVGGTGSDSLNLDMPQNVPSKYEAASQNIVAIAGLNAALYFVNENKDRIYQKEFELTKYLLEKLREIKDVRLYLPEDVNSHIGIISLNIEGYDSADVGDILDQDYNIAVRTGYHCAPYIHKYIDDIKYRGTVRISIGYFTEHDDIDYLVRTIKEIVLEG